MKIKFKLYQYTNGLGETVFQAKEYFGLGLWCWIENPLDTDPRQWRTRDGIMRFLRELADDKRASWLAAGNAKLASKLTLVIQEDVEL